MPDPAIADLPLDERSRSEIPSPEADALAAGPGAVTEAGLRSNASVGFQYISFWLGGRGAVGLDNLLEDAATAELSRSQIWQWVHNGTKLEDGTPIDRALVTKIPDEELARIHAEVGDETWEAGRPDDTQRVFEAVAPGDDFPDFLTEIAYELLPAAPSELRHIGRHPLARLPQHPTVDGPKTPPIGQVFGPSTGGARRTVTWGARL